MRSPTSGRRLDSDSGAVLIETALVLPVVLSLVLVLFDFSMLELKQTQVASAASDGARAGIITAAWPAVDNAAFAGPACPTSSASATRICDAVRQRLAGTAVDSIAVRCYRGQTATVTSCSKADIAPGVDTMVVTVSGTFSPVSLPGKTFLGDSRSFTSSARMVVQ
jgi:Flp pilus assembly protein TadG